MTSKKSKKPLITDRKTDYLFDYFVNDQKFDDHLRGEWDNEDNEKLEEYLNKNPTRKLSGDVTESKTVKPKSASSSSTESTAGERELPSNHSDEKEGSEDSFSVSMSESTTSPFTRKISSVAKPKSEARPKTVERPRTDVKPKTDNRPKSETKPTPLSPVVPQETPEERRARSREAHCTMEELKRKGVIFSRNYTTFDDPDEMEAEIAMQRERKNKQLQVKFYKQIMMGVVSGAEFLNAKYDPFDVELNGWSKQVGADQDDYTEVLEELYEKYKDKGGKMAPEVRLLFMIIMSGVSFHLTKKMIDDTDVTGMVRKNPNIVADLMRNFTNRGGPTAAPPVENVPSKTNDMLAQIREANREKYTAPQTTQREEKNERPERAQREERSPRPPPQRSNFSEASSARPPRESQADIRLRQERDALAEKNRQYEERLHRQDEMYRIQLEQNRRQQDQPKSNFQPINRVLSSKTDTRSIFDDANKSRNKTSEVELFDLVESLESSLTSDVSDMKSTTNNRKTATNRNLSYKKDNGSQSENLSTLSRKKKQSLVL